MWLTTDLTNHDSDKKVRLKCQAFIGRIVPEGLHGCGIAAAA